MSWKSLAWGGTPAGPSIADLAVKDADLPLSNVPSTVGATQEVGLSAYSSLPESVGEKVYRVIEFLRQVPMHKEVSGEEILNGTGVNVNDDAAVQERLQNNPKVVYANSQYAYQAKYNIKNVHQLLTTIEKKGNGLPLDDISDCYIGIEQDIQTLLQEGSIIAVKNVELAVEMLYPRGPMFRTQLSGAMRVEMGSNICQTSVDLQNEIRRGDAVLVGSKWYRVSTAIKAGQSGESAGAIPLSVTTSKPLQTTRKIKYAYVFDATQLPLDRPIAAAPSEENIGATVVAFKYGCSNDIRQLWEDTLQSWPEDRLALEESLLKAGLTTQDALNASRKPIRKIRRDPRKSAKSRKKGQRAIKISNTHLLGTELGNLLQTGTGANDGHSLGAARFEKTS